MVKFLVLIIISTFLLSGCHGCSFVKERFGPKEEVEFQSEEENQGDIQRQSEPIPTNPHHS